MCCGEICSKYSALFKTPSQTKSLNTSNSISATSGLFSFRFFHSSAVMDCVAKKLINSLCISSNCSLVSLLYFIINIIKKAPTRLRLKNFYFKSLIGLSNYFKRQLNGYLSVQTHSSIVLA